MSNGSEWSNSSSWRRCCALDCCCCWKVRINWANRSGDCSAAFASSGFDYIIIIQPFRVRKTILCNVSIDRTGLVLEKLRSRLYSGKRTARSWDINAGSPNICNLIRSMSLAIFLAEIGSRSDLLFFTLSSPANGSPHPPAIGGARGLRVFCDDEGLTCLSSMISSVVIPHSASVVCGGLWSRVPRKKKCCWAEGIRSWIKQTTKELESMDWLSLDSNKVMDCLTYFNFNQSG
jgi:hypothetical protein